MLGTSNLIMPGGFECSAFGAGCVRFCGHVTSRPPAQARLGFQNGLFQCVTILAGREGKLLNIHMRVCVL